MKNKGIKVILTNIDMTKIIVCNQKEADEIINHQISDMLNQNTLNYEK